MSDWRGSIKGIQEAQAAIVRALAAVQPDGGLGEAVQYTLAAGHRYMAAHTVVDTGAWRGSHRPVMTGKATGRIFMDPAVLNPRSGDPPAEYGAELERTRGGRYAVYRKTVEEAGPVILRQAGDRLRGKLP